MHIGTAALSLGAAALSLRALAGETGFRDCGVGARVAESRGIVTTKTADGRFLVVANALDQGSRGFVLLTDIDSGRTRQIFCPEGVRQSAPFGSLMARNGRFYTAQGKVLLELDPGSGTWTYSGIPSATASYYFAFTEAPDGRIWAGCYHTELVSFQPGAEAAVAHGRLDPAEEYLMSLAVDESGWVYGGIGTARCNIVAFNPETGEKRQLVPEAERAQGTARVYTSTDGNAYGTANGAHYRLFEGAASSVSKADRGPQRPEGNVYYGGKHDRFPDGRRLEAYDMPGKWLRVKDPRNGKVRRIEFDYESGGAGITSLAAGPNGMVYASSSHPFHLLRLNPDNGRIVDLGNVPAIGGGNFCAMAYAGKTVFGAEYAGGRLWAYEVTRPWTGGKPPANSVQGVDPQQLVQEGRVDGGHFTYLKSRKVAFLRGDRFGATGHFRLDVPADGEYTLRFTPYRSARYCRVQFAFDGVPLGGPYDARSPTTQAGDTRVHGPFQLKGGTHWLSMQTLETPGAEPWCSLAMAELVPGKPLPAPPPPAPPNPRILAQWKRDICRPRTALMHPDGRHVLMAGFAGYGLCGGGIGIHDRTTGQNSLLSAEKDLLSGHSCITLKALPGGDLVGGTSVSAPGGGHPTATEAELFLVDWATRRLTFHTVPVEGDGNIVSIWVGQDGRVYGLSGKATFFVFDPTTRRVIHRESFSAYGSVPRHALQGGERGELYAMLSKAILRIHPGTFRHEKLADTPVSITAGGALMNGTLCFAGNAHLWTYRLKPAAGGDP